MQVASWKYACVHSCIKLFRYAIDGLFSLSCLLPSIRNSLADKRIHSNEMDWNIVLVVSEVRVCPGAKITQNAIFLVEIHASQAFVEVEVTEEMHYAYHAIFLLHDRGIVARVELSEQVFIVQDLSKLCAGVLLTNSPTALVVAYLVVD